MSTGLATVPPVATPPMLADLRGTLMMLPREEMHTALAEFEDRRNTFRSWLQGKLVEGVHYGFPPGCKNSTANEKQWKAKPSLYKSGADFVTELMGWRCTFLNDVVTWEMMGKPEGIFIQCLIFDGTNREVGQGRGARRKGEKTMDFGPTVKMAEKSAKVNAVIHALNLSDLFTQDIEDMKPVHDNPEADKSQPEQKPRNERVTSEEISRLCGLWKVNNQGATKEIWFSFVNRAAGRDFNPSTSANWTRDDFDKVEDAINTEIKGELPEDY